MPGLFRRPIGRNSQVALGLMVTLAIYARYLGEEMTDDQRTSIVGTICAICLLTLLRLCLTGSDPRDIEDRTRQRIFENL